LEALFAAPLAVLLEAPLAALLEAPLAALLEAPLAATFVDPLAAFFANIPAMPIFYHGHIKKHTPDDTIWRPEASALTSLYKEMKYFFIVK
jgi:hypothetical protein